MNGKNAKKVFTLQKVLKIAEEKGFAVGSFSPRYTAMIRPILRAGEKTRSPVIVQISQKEMVRYGITAKQFSDEFYQALHDENITVPVVLHLDHTKEIAVIREAVAAGFTSVMIDASEKDLEENIATSKTAAEYVHAMGVSIEAELGRIGTTDFVETDLDEQLYTDPMEAQRFVRETNVDALAVSVGTAHGVYLVKEPAIDFERLKAIRQATSVHLVLHGGSGIPPEMIQRAIRLPGGGISKVNIATDLELSVLHALGRKERMSDQECSALPSEEMEKACAAVEATVTDKIVNYLGSNGHAEDFD